MTTISQHDEAILNAVFDPSLPFGSETSCNDSSPLLSFNDGTETEDKCAKQLEIEGVEHAEKGALCESFSSFSAAISIAPNRASCYNNRAQTLRLQGDVDGALRDLDRAIELSEGLSLVASQALTQRGLIWLLRDEQTLAREDLEKAASLGSAFAKKLLVRLNPYAALCNQMLCQMIEQLRQCP